MKSHPRQHGEVTSPQPRRGIFPGSFNPLTIAHIEVARLARAAHDLDTVVLTVSHVALDKPTPHGPTFDERISLLRADASAYGWLEVATTDQQLIADIATGYDVVIMGADKWTQVNSGRYYPSLAERDAAVASLPTVVVAERAGLAIEGTQATLLQVPEEFHDVSSTSAREGDRNLMAPYARKHWGDTPKT